MKKAEYFVDVIKGLYQTNDSIPLHAPGFNGNEKEYLLDTIDSTFVSSVGPYVQKVENFVQGYTQTNKAVAVVNGTTALQIALNLVGVKRGDEVITQALTFVATANSIAYNGASPVFVDVDLDTMGMSPVCLSNFLEENCEIIEEKIINKKTGNQVSAVLPMHTFGFLCRIEEIRKICSLWGLPLIEDAAEALGSTFNGNYAGSFGAMGVFSFNGNKIITSGGGGMLVTNIDRLGNEAKFLTTTAKVAHGYEFFHTKIGFNFRMPNLNAALLMAQLEQLDTILETKKQLYQDYSDELSSGVINLQSIPNSTSKWNYWLMSIKLDGLRERDEFLRVTNKKGVMTRPIWVPMYNLPMYKDCVRGDQTNTEYLSERIVNIPSNRQRR